MRFVDGLEFGAVRESLGPDPPIHILTLLDFHSYFVGYLRRCTLLGRSCSLQVIFDQFRLGFSNWIPNLKFRVVGNCPRFFWSTWPIRRSARAWRGGECLSLAVAQASLGRGSQVF